jgi:3-hydroxyisobutyrate dehydrogenase-like beta-hydroxyacid dehydrogenase
MERNMSVEMKHRLGWAGTGRMGYQLVERLLAAGCDVSVYNRTRAKAEPLADSGATIVDFPAELADRDVVFTMVAASADFVEVVTGPEGILSRPGTAPDIIVDSSTVSTTAGEQVREAAAAVGTKLVAAPVSGNPSVVRSGRLTSVASGPREAFDLVKPYLDLYGAGVTYVGEGEVARLVKICHNLLLGIYTQTLAEITVLAEKAGVSRADFMAFINQSVMGSTFSQYKTPAIVNLDWTPTFTGHLLRKDFELGLEAGRQTDVPLPTTALVHQIVVQLIGNGLGEGDFMRLLEMEANGAGMTLTSENRDVTDGLS